MTRRPSYSSPAGFIACLFVYFIAQPAVAIWNELYQADGNVALEIRGFSPTTSDKFPSGSITLSNIPSGALIESAWLVAGEWSDTFAGPRSAVFAGSNLGNVEPLDIDGSFPILDLYDYRWDVTSLVTGNGTYTASSSDLEHNYGLALAVVYSHSSLPWGRVSLNAGANTLVAQATSTTVLSGSGNAGNLWLYTQADNGHNPNFGEQSGEQIRLNGNLVGGPLDGNLGRASILELQVDTVVGSNVLDITTNDDVFGWHLAGLHSVGVPPSPPQTHVLSIGIEDSPSGHDGHIGAQRVADAFANSFRSVASPSVVTLNTSDVNNADRISAAVDSLRGQLNPGDSLVVYVNGHGIFGDVGDEPTVFAQDDDSDLTSRVSTTGDEAVFLGGATTDDVLSDDAIAAMFDDPLFDAVDKLFVMDTCYAGGFWGTGTTMGDSGDLASLPRTALLAASDEADFSKALTDPDGANWGELGQAVVMALQDLQSFDNVTLGQLASFVGTSQSLLFGRGFIQTDFEANWGTEVEIASSLVVRATDDFHLHLTNIPEPSPLILFIIGLCVISCSRCQGRLNSQYVQCR